MTDELSKDREEVGQVRRPLILIGVEPGADQTDVGKSVVRVRATAGTDERNGETTSAARESSLSFVIFFLFKIKI